MIALLRLSTDANVLIGGSQPMAKVTGTVRSILKHKGSEVWFVTPDQTVYEAIERMAAKAVGALIAISDGKVARIISECDYARKFTLTGTSSPTTLVQ